MYVIINSVVQENWNITEEIGWEGIDLIHVCFSE
jgi:hypothetical protein